jgi:guanylate kinase
MVGPLIILSGPAGSGKTTIVSRLLAMPELKLRPSVSATTRPPRSGERNGIDYYFVSLAEFEARRAAGEFLEWARVHDHWYGTPRRAVEELRRAGNAVMLVIDVQGAAQVRTTCPDAVSIFLNPPTMNVLEQRLRDRHTEDERAIQR